MQATSSTSSTAPASAAAAPRVVDLTGKETRDELLALVRDLMARNRAQVGDLEAKLTRFISFCAVLNKKCTTLQNIVLDFSNQSSAALRALKPCLILGADVQVLRSGSVQAAAALLPPPDFEPRVLEALQALPDILPLLESMMAASPPAAAAV
jgi:hypothetical protein